METTSSTNLLQIWINNIKDLFGFVFGEQYQNIRNSDLIKKLLKDTNHQKKTKSSNGNPSSNVAVQALYFVRHKNKVKFGNQSKEEKGGPSPIIKKRSVGGSNTVAPPSDNNKKNVRFNFNGGFKGRNKRNKMFVPPFTPNDQNKQNTLIDKMIELLLNLFSFPIEEMSWNKYHTWETIRYYLYSIKERYPKLVKIKTIGSTFENRPIIVVKISESQSYKDTIFVEGGIHAREWISPAAATYCIEILLRKWLFLPKHFKNKTWIFLPMVNPDGYNYTWTTDRHWRKNRKKLQSSKCVGVDLNRNFSIGWEKNPFDDPCLIKYKGPSPFSENESQAIRDFLTPLKNYLKAYISLHSFGQEICFYWNLNEEIQDVERVNQVAVIGITKMMRVKGKSYNIKPVAKRFLFGGSRDWARKILEIKYAYVIELRDRGKFGFLLHENEIIPNGKEVFQFLSTVAWAIDDDNAKSKRAEELKMIEMENIKKIQFENFKQTEQTNWNK